ncbi:ATP-binding domain-containing protein [Cyanobacteria bacterium FACHB-63]|nr:ATP-binding domain-containing protein [Cyanobacteria bacterium FACHB-63]
MADWEFIVSEVLAGPGEEAERFIWEKVKQALEGTGEGIACLNYTYFMPQRRYQPDILLVSREQGIVVIEVKSFAIDNLVDIRANQWEMRNFYARHIYPFRQGENQLRQILKRCDRRAGLNGRIPGRVIVALPCISRDEWQSRGFDADHPTCPPLIFGDELGRRSLREALEFRALPLERGEQPLDLSDVDWKELRWVIVGGTQPPPPPPPPPKPLPPRAKVLATLQTFIREFDQQQAKIGIQIPPGPQRIRGIAGSGKTLLLCQKAIRMHLQHPEWDIALVFFTRSLYQLVPDILRTWLHEWSDGQLEPDFVNGKLKVLHAWGARDRLGLYSLLRDQVGASVITHGRVTGTIPERLATNCKRLLENHEIPALFDAILIDEGQDLLTHEGLQIEDKQAIYWLAWNALRPVKENPKVRRLIWAYDEAQSLDSLKVPSYREVFGTELGALLSGQRTGSSYPGGIQKSEVMKRCYRTPGPILVAGHALGMGLLRRMGMLSGFTTQQDWQQIGYEVTGDFRRSQPTITLERPPENSPNPIPALWQQPLIEFKSYSDRLAQLSEIAQRIRHHINEEGLQPSRDLLIIVLGGEGEEARQDFELQHQVAHALRSQGLNYYLPGVNGWNQPDRGSHHNVDTFWMPDAVTVSRIHRAKGHEAKFVYIVGLEAVAQQEDNLLLRNQLFVALTRSMAWVHLSGIQDPDTHTDYVFYEEVRRVLSNGTTLKFTYRRPPQRSLKDDDAISGTLISR